MAAAGTTPDEGAEAGSVHRMRGRRAQPRARSPEGRRGCSAYPDTYEVGLPNQGLQILYEILNERDDARGGADLRALDRPRGRAAGPPASPCSRSTTTLPAGEFDLIAFNLSAELVYTNVLNMVDLAGVPVRSDDRGPGASARRRRWPRRVQPGAVGRLHRPVRARRGRGSRRRDHRGRSGVEGERPDRGLAPRRAQSSRPCPRRLRAVDVRGALRRPAAAAASRPATTTSPP